MALMNNVRNVALYIVMQCSEEAAAVGGLWGRLAVHVWHWGAGVRQRVFSAAATSVSLLLLFIIMPQRQHSNTKSYKTHKKDHRRTL